MKQNKKFVVEIRMGKFPKKNSERNHSNKYHVCKKQRKSSILL